MRLRATKAGVIAQDASSGLWYRLAGQSDVLQALALDEGARASLLERASAETSPVDPELAGLPFQPRSLRAFLGWERHLVQGRRMLIKRFFPAPAAAAALAFERLTGSACPPFRSNARFHEKPAFYVASHTSVLADGQEMWWPSHTNALDFALELACVLKSPLVDASPEQALGAVGGWLVLNNWTARDVQADDARRNVLGPAVKAKTFATSIGCDVRTADALPDWTSVSGRVRVNGEIWCEGRAADPAHSLGDMLAYASEGERLEAGDVISTGTMPGACGLEIDRWIQIDDEIRLEVDGIGTVTNVISASAIPV